MLTVNHDLKTVERDLEHGRLPCPGCGGRLRGWGWARARIIRARAGNRRVRPRRARCAGCLATHVLLTVSLAARRADSAAVIASAIENKIIHAHGHRRIAATIGRPASTVRGWLRAFTACADAITDRFTRLIVRHSPDAAGIWPAPASSPAGAALSALMGYAAGLGDRFGVGTLTWIRAGIAACHGRLFTAGFWTRPPTRTGSSTTSGPAGSLV
ncbi:DUF6431 domain-containing protein [Spelaeicoccus albus]|uniref:DUF6431 domain-containing protein n=1 Tax=Spelaeicoccus albus TaxID=1280376 RepID=UPI003558C2C1